MIDELRKLYEENKERRLVELYKQWAAECRHAARNGYNAVTVELPVGTPTSVLRAFAEEHGLVVGCDSNGITSYYYLRGWGCDEA